MDTVKNKKFALSNYMNEHFKVTFCFKIDEC